MPARGDLAMTTPDNTRRMVSVTQVLDDLNRQVLNLQRAGAYAEAAGIKDAIIRVLRIADGVDQSIDPSEPQS